MTNMLSDDDLTRLLGEAAEAYAVPAPDLAVPAGARGERGERTWLRRRGLQITGIAAAVVVAAVLAQSFGGGTDLLRSETTASDAGGAPNATGGLAGGVGATTGGTTGGMAPEAYGDFDALASAPQPVAPQGVVPRVAAGTVASAPGAAQGAAVGGSAAPDGAEARIVKTGSLSLVVDDGKVTATVRQVTAAAVAVRGYVAGSTSQEYGDSPSATLTLRVPSAAFDPVIGRIRALGAEVVSQETSGRDVTASYADTEAQIASLKAARARFLTILSGARTIGETLTVQQRVDEVQGRIDRLEGQRRVLADQSDLATLTVSIGQEADVELRSSEASGMSKAWDDAKDGFTSGVEGLIARSGRALLVLIVGVAGFFLVRQGWRLARRRLV